MSYHQFVNEDGELYGSFEVFYAPEEFVIDGEIAAVGWYWQACFPGCLPDGDAVGPFNTEQEAIEDAKRC